LVLVVAVVPVAPVCPERQQQTARILHLDLLLVLAVVLVGTPQTTLILAARAVARVQVVPQVVLEAPEIHLLCTHYKVTTVEILLHLDTMEQQEVVGLAQPETMLVTLVVEPVALV
jgi:hypothetical protein